MTSRRPFYRKLQYALLIALLLLAINGLFRPATRGVGGAGGDPGGVLARIREQHHLGQSYLGDVDLAYEAVRLSMLGLQCVADNVLWHKAQNYQKTKNWPELAATIKQLTKLQAYDAKVWDFQAWNLAFNVAADFDDYRQRYRWTIRGFESYLEGMKYTRREATLQNRLAFSINQKIAKSDEKKQFRKLFVADDDFHGARPLAERDNWLLSRQWYLTAEDMVDRQGAKLKGEAPLIFRSHAPMCLMNYADNLEIDGQFGEVARRAWIAAGDAWRQYGLREFITSDGKMLVRLDDKQTVQARRDRELAEFDALSAGLREKIAAEKLQALSRAQRQAWETKPADRTPQQEKMAGAVEWQLRVGHEEIARRAPAPQRARALELARSLDEADERLFHINTDREIVNYDYWRLRADVEQTPELVAAREAIYAGDRAFAAANLESARAAYDRGFAGWRKVLDRHPSLVKDITTGQDLMEVINRYRELLRRSDVPFPKDFILSDVIKQHERNE